jgi:deoxyadenosine/deoxycytidine kinase
MTESDFRKYSSVLDALTSGVRAPDLVIYLDVSPATSRDRLIAREKLFSRRIDFEHIMSEKDLAALKGYCDAWARDVEASGISVLRLDWNVPRETRYVIDRIHEFI